MTTTTAGPQPLVPSASGRTAVPLAGVAISSAVQTSVAVGWLIGTVASPFAGLHPPPLLGVPPAHAVAAGMLALGVVGLAAAVVLRRPGRSRWLTQLAVSALWLIPLAAALLVLDHRLLAAIAYTPLLVAGAAVGWPDGVTVASVWGWPVLYQALHAVGGVLAAAAAVTTARRRRDACLRCGRGTVASRLTPVHAARLGRWAVAVAVLIPLAYAATRYAWALGVPLGISEEVLREGERMGLWSRGAALASLAVLAAGLTLGLQQRWGQTLPRWLPLLGGRTVRPGIAVMPALVAAVLITAAGLAFVRLLLVGALDDFFAGTSWAVLGPELLWPAWGAALAAAALAYRHRRRGTCAACAGGGASPR